MPEPVMESFHFIEVSVTESGGIFRFSDKLPAKAALCCGVLLSADTHHATGALATVSVVFNSGKGQSLNQVLHSPADVKTKTQALLIAQPLDENSVVSGYVKDLGNAPAFPYTLKIYFQLNQ